MAVPTTITADNLANIHLKADAIISDPRYTRDYTPDTAIVDYFINNSPNSFEVLKQGGVDPRNRKLHTAVVHFLNMCDGTVADHTDQCAQGTATDLYADSKTYTISEARYKTVRTSETVWQSKMHTFEEATARILLQLDKELCNDISTKVTATLETNKGVAAMPATGILGITGTFNASTSEVEIGSASFTYKLASYLKRLAKQNRFRRPVIIEGGLLAEVRENAQYETGNSTAPGVKQSWDQLPVVSDSWNLDALTQNKIYLTDAGWGSFVHTNYFSTTPVTYSDGANQTRFSFPSRFINGLMIDVTRTTSCSNANVQAANDINFVYKGVTNFDLFVNPTGCLENNTGVIAIKAT